VGLCQGRKTALRTLVVTFNTAHCFGRNTVCSKDFFVNKAASAVEQFPPVSQYFLGHDNEKLNYFSISSEMVKKKLDKLKMNKAFGVDAVGTRMLMELSEVISE